MQFALKVKFLIALANVDRWPGPRLTNWGDPAPAK